MAIAASTRPSMLAVNRAASAPYDEPSSTRCWHSTVIIPIASANVSKGVSHGTDGWASPPNQRNASAVTPCDASMLARSTSTRPLEPARTRTPVPFGYAARAQ
jgi:hypothetical protein